MTLLIVCKGPLPLLPKPVTESELSVSHEQSCYQTVIFYRHTRDFGKDSSGEGCRNYETTQDGLYRDEPEGEGFGTLGSPIREDYSFIPTGGGYGEEDS